MAPGAASRLDSATGPVSFNYPHFRRSDFGVRQRGDPCRGGYSGAEASAGTSDDCTTDALFRDAVTVGAGTSGLPPGAPVTLRLDADITGQIDSGVFAHDSFLGSVDVFVSYKLTGTELDCSGGEGCEFPALASLVFDLSRVMDSSTGTPSDPDGSVTDALRWGWDLTSNASPPQGDSEDSFVVVCPAYPDACAIGPGVPSPKPFEIPVGARSIELQTTVGAEIAIEGRLNILSQAYGPGLAYGDLLHSLHSGISAAPGYEGITLSYESNPVGPGTDTTPPDVNFGAADGVWHSGNVAITCTAADSGSGLANAADAAFALDTNVPDGAEDGNAQTGTRQVCDVAGNCATAGPIGGNKIDRKAPALVMPANLTVQATSVASAVVDLPTATASDGGSGVAIVNCPSGPTTLPLGTTLLSCSATDNVGHSSSGSYTVTVKGAKAQLGDLIAKVVNASQLSAAAKTLLIGKLNALLASFDPNNATQRQAVCLALQAFKAAVQLQAGHTITPAQATGWIADANRIRAVLAC